MIIEEEKKIPDSGLRKIEIEEVFENDYKIQKVDIDHESGIHLVRNVEFKHEKASYSRIINSYKPSYRSSNAKKAKNSDQTEKIKIPWKSELEFTDKAHIKFEAYKPKYSSHSKSESNDYTNTSTPKVVGLSTKFN